LPVAKFGLIPPVDDGQFGYITKLREKRKKKKPWEEKVKKGAEFFFSSNFILIPNFQIFFLLSNQLIPFYKCFCRNHSTGPPPLYHFLLIVI
jgi:hypothetical protein